MLCIYDTRPLQSVNTKKFGQLKQLFEIISGRGCQVKAGYGAKMSDTELHLKILDGCLFKTLRSLLFCIENIYLFAPKLCSMNR